MIKADLKKTYDSISWDILDIVLLDIGFDIKFIGSVSLLSLILFLSMVEHIDIFKVIMVCNKEIPFPLTIYYLFRLLKTSTQHSDFKFHSQCNSVHLTHMTFANDLLMFSRGDAIQLVFY